MYSFNIFSLLGFAVSIFYFLTGFYILIKNSKALANKLFFFLALAMTMWGFTEAMTRASLDAKTALFWGGIGTFGAILVGPFFLHFWLEFSSDINEFKKRLPIFVVYLPAIIFSAIRLFFPALMIKDMVKEYWGYSTVGTPFYLLYMAVIVIYMTFVFYLIVKKYFKSYGKFKIQIRNIGLGVFISLVFGIATQFLKPILHINIPELTVLSSIVLSALVTYSASKYSLLSITPGMIAENILSTMEDYLLVVDSHKKITFINGSLLKNLDRRDDELLDKPVMDLLAADIFLLPDEQFKNRLPLFNYEMELISKDGKKIPVSANISVLKEISNEMNSFIFVLRDMRQIKNLINDLEQKTDDLEKTKKVMETKVAQLEQINKLMVGRELKMAEMKKEIEELKKKLDKT